MDGHDAAPPRPGSETAALDRLKEILGSPARPDVLRGIDDDCAVLGLSGGYDLLLTVDTVVRDVHFDAGWQTPEGIGWRALAASVSDIAAMAGEPMAVLVAVAAEGGWDPAIPGIYKGMRDLGSRLGVDVVGGDLTRLPVGLSLSLTVVGRVESGRAVLRSGARPGDEIWVTGRLGDGWAVRESARSAKGVDPAARAAYERILPRVEEARFLARKVGLTSMIDLSDGLSTDLSHICRQSGTGALIEAERVPLSGGLAGAAERGADPVDVALEGGEDFELCLTAPPGGCGRIAGEFRRRFGLPVTRVGRITKSGMRIRRKDGGESELRPRGYDHIRSGERER